MGQLSFYPQIIPDDALDLTFPPLEYQADFSSIIGDAGTQADGFDEVFQALTDYGGTSGSVLDELDAHLTELDAVAPGLGIPIEQDAVDSYNAAVQNGQPAIDTFQSSQTGARGPVYPGAIMAWLGGQKGQDIGALGGGDANVDQNPDEISILTSLGFKFNPLVGDPPFPTKWFIRTKAGQAPPRYVRVALVSDNKVFFRVWYDDLSTLRTNSDWHFYVDINPIEAGVHCATVRFYFDDSHYDAFTMQIYIQAHGPAGATRPAFSCPIDPGNPVPPTGRGF